jgi:hypothetical protein
VQVPVPHGREFRRLAETFNRLARDLRRNQERVIEQERLRKELEIGRRIQVELLPRGALRSLFAEIRGVSIPAREVGGDFFNYFALSESETGGAGGRRVGQGSGRGAADGERPGHDPRAAVGRARPRAPRRHARPRDGERGAARARTTRCSSQCSTVPSGRLRYVNAGHNTQIVLRHDGAEWLSSTGRPPGPLPGGGFEEREIQLRGGDALFLFTDGLVEAEDESGEPFGMDVSSSARSARTQDLTRLLGHVDAAVRAHRGRSSPPTTRRWWPCASRARARGPRVRRQLEALEAREWDVLVVGAGSTAPPWPGTRRSAGSGRGARRARDFGSGTSWNSLKTIHGGMRHLQRLEIGSLRESARERSTLLRIAAPLVAPLGFFVPCSGHGARGRAAFAVALALQDALTRDRNRGLPPERSIPDGRTVGAAEALRLVPGLEPRRPHGGGALARRAGAELGAAAARLRARGGRCRSRGREPRGGARAATRERTRGGRSDPGRAHRAHAGAARPGS